MTSFYDQDDPQRHPPSAPAGTMPPERDDWHVDGDVDPDARYDDWTDAEVAEDERYRYEPAHEDDHRDADDHAYAEDHAYADDHAYAEDHGDVDGEGYADDHHDDLGYVGDPDDDPGDRRGAGRHGRHGARHDYVVLKGRRGGGGHRVLLVLGVIATFLVVLGAAGWWWYQRQIDPPGPPGEAVRVVIPSGTSTSGIGSILDGEDVIANGTIWNLYTSRKDAGPFRAGTYTLRKNSDLDSVIAVLEKGPTKATSSGAYLPAGLTVDELTTQLSKGVDRWSVDEIDAALRSGEVRSSLQPAGQSSWEGLLYPGTYTVSRRTELVAFLNDLASKMEKAVADQDPDPSIAAINEKWELDLSTYDVLTVASLIQREAGSEAEMPKIATVIYNRLADGERLGIDATSLYYAKQQGTDVDFSADTPYNTRTHDGLPPTPISTIDDAALRAALHPADGSWRYYVLVQKGKHLFTDDPDEFEKGRQLCIERDLGCG